MPTEPNSSLFESVAFKKICPPPLAVSLALVETSCPVNVPPAVGSFVPSATVMFALPLKTTPLMVLEVCKVVAVVALPERAPEKVAAVRVPAPLRVATTELFAYHLNWAADVGTEDQKTPASTPKA